MAMLRRVGPHEGVLLAGPRLRALAAGFRAAGDSARFELFTMWVVPEHRRQDHATRLVEGVAVWASDQGGRELALWVTDPGARALL